jgi:molybdopterin synthase sulfur carrier subunit
MPELRIDGFLREFGPPARASTTRDTVAGVLDELEATYPRLRLKLRDEMGELRRFVRVFVNGEDIRNGEGLATPLKSADEVEILHSIQGG